MSTSFTVKLRCNFFLCLPSFSFCYDNFLSFEVTTDQKIVKIIFLKHVVFNFQS